MAVIGISAIIAASATLLTIVRFLGAAYLAYLGLKAVFHNTSIDLGRGRMPISATQAFRQAILAELLIPKTALFFLAFLPQFVVPENGFVVIQLTIPGLDFAMIGFLSPIVYSVAAGALGDVLRRNPTIPRWQGKIVGSIYCALGLRLAFLEQ